MAKKPPKETSTPLIFALVFFVLTTIAFGVMWYMQFSEAATVTKNRDDGKKEVSAANAVAKDAEEKAKLYRIYLGIDEGEERTSLLAEHKAGDKIAAEVKRINAAVAKKAGVEDVSKLPPEFQPWTVDDKDALGKVPETSILAALSDLHAKRKAAEANAAAALKDYSDTVAAIKKAIAESDKARTNYNDVANALPKKFEADLAAEVKKFEARTKKYADSEGATRDELAKEVEEKMKAERKLKTADDRVKELQTEIAASVAKMVEKRDKFEYDEPQGKILRRLPDGVIEISLGTADLLRPGLTFTILPSDFPEKGRQSRVRVLRVQDERGRYQNVERFVEKATVEVTEVVGPHLARARITNEFDPIRDAAGPGDLLYNSVWRKGTADHIALVGIFDINGDGQDDIETVVRDMTRMGVPVDAYFDLRKRQWVGQVTEQTRYVVVGNRPASSATDPNQIDKTALLDAMGKAVEGARARGVQDVAFRDFFPRMGYRVKIDVPLDKINQATAPYLNRVVGDNTPPDKP